jgi:23S rRNA pseudouridine2457 synthase
MLVLFNKPYNVLSQFTDHKSPTKRLTLSDFISIKGVYPAGRLDKDSEGLLLLTDNGKLQHKIAHPNQNKDKTYWVQVDGAINQYAINMLANGIQLKDGLTRPAKVRIITPPVIWNREPPIRSRKEIPTTWIELIISEGKNRQIRRMTAAVGFPTLRLIRTQIEKWKLDKLQPGQYVIINSL